jgi:hypothetical protein
MKILCSLFVFLTVAAAEERPLLPIERPKVDGEVRCLPFFALTTVGGVEKVVFWYKDSAGKTDRNMVPKKEISVRIVEEKDIPTYEKDDQDVKIFRMNQAEYKRSKDCLPPPEKSPTQ